jgi:hypothetical protein
MFDDVLLAQSAADRFNNAAYGCTRCAIVVAWLGKSRPRVPALVGLCLYFGFGMRVAKAVAIFDLG